VVPAAFRQLACFGILLGGCAGASDAPASIPAADGCDFSWDAAVPASLLGNDSFRVVYERVLHQPCVDCHKPGGLSAFLDMSTPVVAYQSLVGVDAASDGVCAGAGKRVVPGDCANSLLFRKLDGAEQRCGSRMPLREYPVQQPGIDLVCRWIQAGARCDAK
jgi:hypothetical protein